MKLKTISVIIPVYKVEQYLNQCITSILNQTYKRLEIILVDDGSPDQCGMICDEWAEKDPRIKVVHKKNGGLSDARNAGIDVADGEFIAFVDSDDFIAPTMMEELMAALIQKNADIVECNYFSFIDGQVLEENIFSNEVTSYATKEALSFLMDERKFKYTVWNKLYRRKIFRSLRFEVGKLHEDVFFTYQAFGLCRQIVKIENTLYYYRQRSNSIMSNTFSLRNLDSLEARKRQYFYIKEKFSELSGKAQSQVLRNCLYLGQKALRESDIVVAQEAIRRIEVLFDEVYTEQTVQENKKQKMWYRIAGWNLQICCLLRNKFKIGL